MPWVLAKDEANKDRLATVLYNLVESICIGASLLESFMPETASNIVSQLSTKVRTLDELNQFGLYESGTKVTDAPKILFARLDLKEVLESGRDESRQNTETINEEVQDILLLILKQNQR